MEENHSEKPSEATIRKLQQLSKALYEEHTEKFKTVLSSLSPELVRIS